jgi:hypothetical protein
MTSSESGSGCRPGASHSASAGNDMPHHLTPPTVLWLVTPKRPVPGTSQKTGFGSLALCSQSFLCITLALAPAIATATLAPRSATLTLAAAVALAAGPIAFAAATLALGANTGLRSRPRATSIGERERRRPRS